MMPGSSNFFASVFEASRKMTQTTDWNRPTAVDRANLVALDAALVDEDGNRLACALNQRVAQGERTVELATEDAAEVHNQQDDDGGADARQGDVPDFAQAARTVHFRRFVQLRLMPVSAAR